MQGRLSALILGDREDPRHRLAALFGGTAPESGQPPEPALDWARGVLAARHGEVSEDEEVSKGEKVSEGQEVSEGEAVRLLRAAEPRLLLKPAQFLAKHAVRS